MEKTGFMIVIADNNSYVIPSMPEIPTALYMSYLDAKRALLDIMGKFDLFIPVAYGSAYPYENTTFEHEITNKEFAMIGWVISKDEEADEDEDPVRIPLGLLKVAYSG
jgi:hypothetical protein